MKHRALKHRIINSDEEIIKAISENKSHLNDCREIQFSANLSMKTIINVLQHISDHLPENLQVIDLSEIQIKSENISLLIGVLSDIATKNEEIAFALPDNEELNKGMEQISQQTTSTNAEDVYTTFPKVSDAIPPVAKDSNDDTFGNLIEEALSTPELTPPPGQLEQSVQPEESEQTLAGKDLGKPNCFII